MSITVFEEMASKPTYRIMIMAASEPYEHGDYADGEAGEEQRAAVDRAIEQHGVWGFVVENHVDCGEAYGEECTPCDGHWEHVDSCFGFIGNDDGYMMEQALASIPAGYGDVQVVDENGREINTVSK